MKAFFSGIGRFLFGTQSTSKGEQRPMFEPLESRQFLSASTDSIEVNCTGQNCAVEAAAATTVDYSQVINKYKGTIQTSLRPRPFKGMINIQSINSTTGKVKGLVSIPFLVDNFKFALKGTVRPDGTFTFTFKRPGISANLTGQYSPDGHLVGDFSAKGPPGSVTGTIDFHKI